MGVDYSGIGGIGIEITNDVKKKLVMANEGNFDGDLAELLDDLELQYSEAGDGNYSGNDNVFYIMVEGDTLGEINENSKHLTTRLNNMNIKITADEFRVISDLHVW